MSASTNTRQEEKMDDGDWKYGQSARQRPRRVRTVDDDEKKCIARPLRSGDYADRSSNKRSSNSTGRNILRCSKAKSESSITCRNSSHSTDFTQPSSSSSLTSSKDSITTDSLFVNGQQVLYENSSSNRTTGQKTNTDHHVHRRYHDNDDVHQSIEEELEACRRLLRNSESQTWYQYRTSANDVIDDIDNKDIENVTLS